MHHSAERSSRALDPTSKSKRGIKHIGLTRYDEYARSLATKKRTLRSYVELKPRTKRTRLAEAEQERKQTASKYAAGRADAFEADLRKRATGVQRRNVRNSRPCTCC